MLYFINFISTILLVYLYQVLLSYTLDYVI